MPEETLYEADLVTCEGNPLGRMCCSYGPQDKCFLIMCRASCEAEWEPQNVICRE